MAAPRLPRTVSIAGEDDERVSDVGATSGLVDDHPVAHPGRIAVVWMYRQQDRKVGSKASNALDSPAAPPPEFDHVRVTLAYGETLEAGTQRAALAGGGLPGKETAAICMRATPPTICCSTRAPACPPRRRAGWT